MPRSSQRKTKTVSEMRPTLQKLDAIDNWLQKMLDRFPQKGQLTTSEIEDWHKDLGVFSLEAIEFAFEKHRTNAIFFPINGQIMDLCISFEPPEQSNNTSPCDAACRARHGKGYGWSDIQWLWNRVSGQVPFYFNNAMPRLDRTLVQARALAGRNTVVVVKARSSIEAVELDALLRELDAARGANPEWRHSPE